MIVKQFARIFTQEEAAEADDETRNQRDQTLKNARPIYLGSFYMLDIKVFCDVASVNRWLDYISTFGHLHQWKLAQWHTKFAKVGPRYSPIVNKPSKMTEDFAKMAKFRKIWSHWHTAMLHFGS